MNIVKDLRKQARWTQVELAVKSGTSTRSTSQAETAGLGSLTPRTGRKIIEALSRRLMDIRKIEEPLDYDALMDKEEQEGFGDDEDEEASSKYLEIA